MITAVFTYKLTLFDLLIDFPRRRLAQTSPRRQTKKTVWPRQAPDARQKKFLAQTVSGPDKPQTPETDVWFRNTDHESQ
jgi:hypothetical protein